MALLVVCYLSVVAEPTCVCRRSILEATVKGVELGDSSLETFSSLGTSAPATDHHPSISWLNRQRSSAYPPLSAAINMFIQGRNVAPG